MPALATLLALLCSPAPPAGPDLPIALELARPDGSPARGVPAVLYRSVDDRRDAPEILARAVTDDAGRCTLALPAQELEEPTSFGFFGLAAGDEGGFAAAWMPAASLPVGAPLGWTLPAPREWSLVVRDADGAPVPSAVVRLTHVADPGGVVASLPDELCDLLSATTDGEGRARFRSVPREHVAVVEVVHGDTTDRFYTPNMTLGWLDDRPLVLRPRSITRLTHDPGSDPALGGVVLELASYETTPPGADMDRPRDDVHVRVRVPAPGESVEGRLPADGYASVAAKPAPLTLRVAREEGLVRISSGASVRVRGRVVDDSGAVVPGVRVLLHGVAASEWVTTDAEGAYETDACPGTVFVELVAPPPGYGGRRAVRDVSTRIPADAERATLPDLTLVARTIEGVCVGEDGTPVTGALVWGEGASGAFAGRMVEGVNRGAVSDADGRFTLRAVPREAALQLTARAPGMLTLRPVVAEDGVRLVLTPALAFAGRVSAATEGIAPRTDLGIELGLVLATDPERDRWWDEDVPLPSPVRVAADGTFTFPPTLLPGEHYRVVARADGFVTARSEATDAARLASAGVALELWPLATIAGRLVDARGEPLANARVFVRGGASAFEERTTDADGRFAFDGVAPAGTLVFADLGERFFGRWLAPGEERVWQVGGEEDAGRRLRPEPEHPRRDELAVALQVLAGAWERARASGDERERLRALEGLARIDPAGTLHELEQGVVRPGYVPIVERNIVEALAGASPDEALAVAQRQDSAYSSVMNLCKVADALPEDARARKLELLALARAKLRQVDDPGPRLVLIGWLGERLTDLGLADSAEEVLRTGIPLADELGHGEWPGFARASFAEELARYDRETALRLIGELEPESDRGRHLGNTAHELAAVDPAGAEDALRRISESSSWPASRYAPRVVHDMAPVDPDRAERLADELDDSGYSHGMAALALADADPARAGRLLEAAFARLEAGAREGHDGVAVGAALLAVVERVDPEHGDDWIARVLSLRMPAAELLDPSAAKERACQDGRLAACLARYDRETARALCEEAVPELAGENAARLSSDWSPLLAAVALVDPEWGGRLAAEWPGPGERVIGAVLARPPEERWDFVVAETLNLWTVGREDL